MVMTMKLRKSRTISTSVEEPVYLALRKLSTETGRSTSGYIRWLVNQHLRELEKAENSEPSPDQ